MAHDPELDRLSLTWLNRFVDHLLVMWAAMGVLAVAVSVSRVTFTGWLPIYTAHCVLLAITLGVTFYRKRLPATFKARFAIVSNILVAASGIWTMGLMSGGVWFFPVAVLLLALFVARGRAAWVAGGIFAFMVGTGIAFMTGVLQLPAPAAVIAVSPQQWMVYFIASGFFLVSLVLMVSHYKTSMSDLLGELRRQRDEISRLADFDHLTGLPVARLARDRLDMACRRAQREAGRAAVLFIDLDGFKDINDAAGHAAGDYCLAVIAKRLAGMLRGEDTAARVGGDEFVIVMSQASGRDGAALLAARLVREVAEPIDYQGRRFTLGASVGVAVYPDDGTDADTLLRRADHAMYAVKRAGKNAFAFADAAE